MGMRSVLARVGVAGIVVFGLGVAVQCQPATTTSPEASGASDPAPTPPTPVGGDEDGDAAEVGDGEGGGDNAPPVEQAATDRPDGASCLAASECASGICEGEGCGDDQPGTCQPSSRMCTRDLRQYCGCDGETFGASGSCPGRRFATRAPCDGA